MSQCPWSPLCSVELLSLNLGVVVKSEEERKAAADERKAMGDERIAAMKAKTDARLAKIEAWGNKGKPEALGGIASGPPSQSPHRGPTLAGILFPPLGAYQVVRMTVDQVKELKAMSPEERLEFTRRNPGFGSGGS